MKSKEQRTTKYNALRKAQGEPVQLLKEHQERMREDKRVARKRAEHTSLSPVRPKMSYTELRTLVGIEEGE